MTAWTLQELVDNQLQVTLPAGTISVTGSTTLRSGQTITGHPLGTTIQLAAGAYAADVSLFYVSAVTGVTIQGVRFDGNQANTPNSARTYGVQVASGGGANVVDCEFYNVEDDGILMSSSTAELTVTGCSFNTITRYGIICSGGQLLTVTDCHFPNCTTIGINVNAYTTNITVTDCDFVGSLANSERRLLSIFGTVGSSSENILVSNCRLTDGYLRLTEVDGAVVQDCQVSYMSTAGENGAMELQGAIADTQITDCTFRGGGTSGCLRVVASTATRMGVNTVVTRCTMISPSTCGDGVTITGSYGVTIDSCDIRRSGTTGTGNGIRAQSTITAGADMTGFVFKDNTITGFGTGISLVVDRQNIVNALLCDNSISGHTTHVNETEAGGFTITLDATGCA